MPMTRRGCKDSGVKGLKAVGWCEWQVKDVIKAVDNQPVEDVEDLFDLIGPAKAGETLQLTVYRKGQLQEIPVTLNGAEK